MSVIRWAVFALTFAAFSGCVGEDLDSIAGRATPDPSEGEVFSSSIVASAGGTLATPGGTASVDIPAAALANDTEITLRVRERSGPTKTSVYEFGPDGTQFDIPVTVAIEYDGDAEDRTPVLAWKDGDDWKAIPGSASREGKVAARLPHFTEIAVILVADDAIGPPDQGVGDESTAVYFTWTDPSSSLTWQVPSAVRWMGWQEAVEYCEQLPLDGGGWHLPTIGELRSLIRDCSYTETGGACGVTDSCLEQYACWGDGVDVCNGCSDGGCNWDPALYSETESECLPPYWSSSLYSIALEPPPPPSEDEAWGVMFAGGAITHFWRSPERTANLGDKWKVRCVRATP